MPGAFPESRVVEIWRDRVLGRTDLLTEDNEPVRIVYPGRLNGDRGADYRDAVIATRGGLLRGDVEIHVKSSHWWAHRHHHDPVYNRVVLHVVLWHDVARAVILQNGKKVPTLTLYRFIEGRTGGNADPVKPLRNCQLPCRNTLYRRDTDFTGGVLDSAGEQRFLSRVAEFQAELNRLDTSQFLYRGILGALGYSKNKCQMLELAERMPLYRLESATTGIIPDAECLARYQAMLLGMAGLLHPQRTGACRGVNMAGDWVTRLERIWADCCETAAMSEDDWHFFKVRPGNQPARRIVAMCYLLLRYRGEGMLKGLLDRLDVVAVETGYREIERALLVADDGYQVGCANSGLPGGRGLPALLGRGRVADIAVNVFLPFAVAWGWANSYKQLAAKALEIYHQYPVLDGNALEKHMMRQLGTGRYLVNSARRQQGLLHIYKTLCSQGKCRDCPVVSEIG